MDYANLDSGKYILFLRSISEYSLPHGLLYMPFDKLLFSRLFVATYSSYLEN